MRSQQSPGSYERSYRAITGGLTTPATKMQSAVGVHCDCGQDSPRLNEAESQRYELYREIWCNEFRDIREDRSARAVSALTPPEAFSPTDDR